MSERASGRPGRRLDAVALGLLALGAAAYLYAFRGMSGLEHGTLATGKLVYTGKSIAVDGGPLAMDRWTQLRRLSFVGLGLAGAGLLTGIVAAVRHARSSHSPAR